MIGVNKFVLYFVWSRGLIAVLQTLAATGSSLYTSESTEGAAGGDLGSSP